MNSTRYSVAKEWLLKYMIVNPYDSYDLLNSNDKDVQKIVNEYRAYVIHVTMDGSAAPSFPAWVLSKRHYEMNYGHQYDIPWSTETLRNVALYHFSESDYEDNANEKSPYDMNRSELLEQIHNDIDLELGSGEVSRVHHVWHFMNGFINDETISWIHPSDSNLLYNTNLDNAIKIQEKLVNELLFIGYTDECRSICLTAKLKFKTSDTYGTYHVEKWTNDNLLCNLYISSVPKTYNHQTMISLPIKESYSSLLESPRKDNSL